MAIAKAYVRRRPIRIAYLVEEHAHWKTNLDAIFAEAPEPTSVRRVEARRSRCGRCGIGVADGLPKCRAEIRLRGAIAVSPSQTEIRRDAASPSPRGSSNLPRVVPAVLSLAPFGFGLSSQRTVGPVAPIGAEGVVTRRDRMARTWVSTSRLTAAPMTSECIVNWNTREQYQ